MSDDTGHVLQISGSWDAYQTECPTRLVLNRIADKWAVLVLGLLETETKRFSTLQREIGGISQKMLTQTLRGLERGGLIARTIYPTVPPKVEYTITPLGKTLVGLLAALRVWAEAHIEEVHQAQSNYDKAEQAGETANGVRTVRF